MIITLIVAVVIVIGIICMIIDDAMWNCPDWVSTIAISFPILGLFVSMFVGGFIINANVIKDIEYQNMLYEKEMLEYRIDNMGENIVGNEMLYNDIVEFNNELRSVKKWANSPWTNWFNNSDIATIDYIEFDNL